MRPQLTTLQIHDLIAELLDVDPVQRAEWLARRFPDDAVLRGDLLAAVSNSEDGPAITGSQSNIALALHIAPAVTVSGPIGRYEIIDQLGAGGMGVVFLARDPGIKRQIALKLLSEQFNTEDLRQRFRREAMAAGRLRHQNIVTIFDVGEHQGRPFIAMEYIPGRTLADIIADEIPLALERRLPLERKLQIVEDLCAGLAAAHRDKVIHRDIKPENIMVDSDGVVKILDFGIAKAVHPDDLLGAPLTIQHTLIGTTGYIAPEHLVGGVSDDLSDMFAAAVVAYELLTCHKPFGTTAQEIAQRTMLGDVTPMSTFGAGMPAAIERIVVKGLAVKPQDRFEGMAAMQRAFAVARKERGSRARSAARVPAWLAATVVALAIVIAVVVVSCPFPPVARPPPTSVSVLVADFDNRTGDAVFDGALEQSLMIAMEGASFVTAYPRRDAQRLAQQVRNGARLDAQTARLVAFREGITYVLAGSVASSGAAVMLQLDAIQPAAGRVERSAKATARGKGDVLSAVGALAARVRIGLGDTTPESAQLAAMETFTAGSLDAMREYSLAQDLAKDGRGEEAVAHYRRAVESDPNFGRAYSGLAVSAQRLGRSEESQAAWTKALSLMDRMSEREKYRTLGAYYLGSAHNYEKAAENFTALVQKYPGDSAGFGNLALAHFYLRDFAKAFDEGRRGVAIDRKNILQRNNLALYAMYSGDFAAGSAEATRVLAENPNLETAYLPVVMHAIERGDLRAAEQAYADMARAGAVGASLASIGRADLALYGGQFDSAQEQLEKGITADLAARNTAGVALKRVALAETYVDNQWDARGADAARAALRVARQLSTLVPAARVLVRAGQVSEARTLANEAGAQLPNQHRAYSRIILAEAAMKESNFAEAIDLLTQATRFADVWLARFDLGIAYVQTEHFPEAISEFDQCENRRGEVTALFFDDVPTYRYLAPLRYWKGRALEGLGSRDAAIVQYRSYLDLRSRATADPLVEDARRRVTGR